MFRNRKMAKQRYYLYILILLGVLVYWMWPFLVIAAIVFASIMIPYLLYCRSKKRKAAAYQAYCVAWHKWRDEYEKWYYENTNVEKPEHLKTAKELEVDSVLELVYGNNVTFAVMDYVRKPDLHAVVKVFNEDGLSDKGWDKKVAHRIVEDKYTGQIIEDYDYIQIDGKDYRLKKAYKYK